MRYLTEDDVATYAEAFFKIASSLHYASTRDLHIRFNDEDTRVIIHDWNRYNNTQSRYKDYVVDTLEFSIEVGEYFYVFCEFERSYKDEPHEFPLQYGMSNTKLNRVKCTLYEYTIDAEEFDNYMVIATLMAADLRAVRSGY